MIAAARHYVAEPVPTARRIDHYGAKLAETICNMDSAALAASGEDLAMSIDGTTLHRRKIYGILGHVRPMQTARGLERGTITLGITGTSRDRSIELCVYQENRTLEM